MMKDGLSDVQRSIAQDAVSRRFDDASAATAPVRADTAASISAAPRRGERGRQT